MAAIVQKFDADSPDPDQFARFMGPGHGDQMIRGAIQTVWMTLPSDRKSLDALEQEFRLLVDRAFRDMREDEKRLGKKGP
jgi:hypothetical protein